MPDRKISELPAATLPLTGAELVPLVQGADTDRAPASELGKVSGCIDLAATDPTPPAAGTVRLFRRSVAGRQMPAFVGPAGLDTALQPFFARNKIGRYSPAGNGTVVSTDALPSPSSAGTSTGRFWTATNLFTRSRRVGYVSAATAASLAVLRSAEGQFTTGNGANLGGFHLVMRFGLAALTADMRFFAGMRPAVAPTNVEPSTLNQCIGIGRGAADTNLRLFFGGSTAQAPIDLGPNFPANTANVDLYELALFAAPGQVGTINWQVTRLNTGDVAQGQVVGDATVVPSTVTPLAPVLFVTNNATASAVAFDLVSIYLETDF